MTSPDFHLGLYSQSSGLEPPHLRQAARPRRGDMRSRMVCALVGARDVENESKIITLSSGSTTEMVRRESGRYALPDKFPEIDWLEGAVWRVHCQSSNHFI